MAQENSPTQISYGNRSLKVMSIVFATSYVILAGIVGFLLYERVVGVDSNYPHTSYESSQQNLSLHWTAEQISKEAETIEKLANDVSEMKHAQDETTDEITATHQNITSKYHALVEEMSEMKHVQNEMNDKIIDIRQNATSTYRELHEDVNEIRETLIKTREYYNTIYHGLRVETHDNIDAINISHRELQLSLETLKQTIDESKTSGATYVHWGRTTCQGNGSDIVYSGYAGGSRHTHKGAAVSMLCLPTDPDWELHTTNEDVNTAFIYGTEYQSGIGRLDKIFGSGHKDQDVPCAVCNIRSRSSVIMIPAKTKCHPGWTVEFTGYLMAGCHNHEAATDYYCIDKEPENVVGGREGINDDGRLLYFVEARCGSLKCPPYVNGRELTCVVCSK